MIDIEKNDKTYTWTNEAERKRDIRHRKIANIKSAIFMRWSGFYWKVLHLTRLARPYSIAMCKTNLYRKFPDGRCMWCGGIH